ncbi:class I SAM-dependent methyltransferase [Amycolatopsis carbonis]|uniref:Class I SAM-dependent methyltransferase n=1 Tax=Amycolatopsis carbonis TaxID=715471 RepID=A0A9Y2IP09_9PSEU|nr:class I SAM-dependent methyltransferase [Amycolatopsis sp. 2-15]WIX82521.1 class I SAM-dependent methyltransferase [Amycolatopsis sp. 2-15]
MTTPAEAFMAAYHDRKPHMTSDLIDSCRVVDDGRTSYQVLAARVSGTRCVLDLGCGDGSLLAAIEGAEVLAGVDLSAAHLDVARARPELADADLRLARVQELPFADGSFDAVVSHMVLMLFPDADAVIAEAARVLAPGGVFAAAIAGGVTGALKVFIELANSLLDEVPEERRVHIGGNPRIRRREGLDAMLGAACFEPVSWDPIDLDFGGPEADVWARCCETFYPVGTLDAEQLKRLESAFREGTRDLVENGRLRAGMTMRIVETRLRAGLPR